MDLRGLMGSKETRGQYEEMKEERKKAYKKPGASITAARSLRTIQVTCIP